MNKRQTVWNRLQEEMKAKRKRPDPRGKGKSKKSGSTPHELIVQRLASEPDNKQTFRPVQPSEFVAFPYEDLTLTKLKKACADHYSLPASLCDVLVLVYQHRRNPSHVQSNVHTSLNFCLFISVVYE